MLVFFCKLQTRFQISFHNLELFLISVDHVLFYHHHCSNYKFANSISETEVLTVGALESSLISVLLNEDAQKSRIN